MPLNPGKAGSRRDAENALVRHSASARRRRVKSVHFQKQIAARLVKVSIIVIL
jgi:hypothetical protein